VRGAGGHERPGRGYGHLRVGEVRRQRGDLAGAEAAYAEAHRHGRDPQPGLSLLWLAQGKPRPPSRRCWREGCSSWSTCGPSSRLDRNVGNPMAPWLYAVSALHCMAVSLAEGGAGLGTIWGEELALDMLAAAGFVDIEVHEIPADPIDSVYVAHKPS